MSVKLNRESRLQRIIDTQSAIVQAEFDLDIFMKIVTKTVQELTEGSGAVVELVDGDYMVYRCASGLIAPHTGLRLKRQGSMSGLCVETAQVLYCKDAELDPRVDRVACRRVGVCSMICAPLLRGGHPVGVLKVMSGEPNAFHDDDVQTLTLLSGMLGAALGKQLDFDALQHAETCMRVLLENANDAVVSFDESGQILRWNQAAERLFEAPAHEAIGWRISERKTPGASLLSEIFDEYRNNSTLFQRDLRQERQLALSENRMITLEYNVCCNTFGRTKEITMFLHDVTLRKSFENTMYDMAHTDGLTGLPNRRKVLEALHAAIARAHRQPRGMALLFLDMNGFKQINDLYGHNIGDQALLAFSQRIRGCVRESDLVGRLGGDEFVVLAESIESEADAQNLASRVVAALAPAMADTHIQLATSIGICFWQPTWSADEWLSHADMAMYLAKHQTGGSSRIAVYDV